MTSRSVPVVTEGGRSPTVSRVDENNSASQPRVLQSTSAPAFAIYQNEKHSQNSTQRPSMQQRIHREHVVETGKTISHFEVGTKNVLSICREAAVLTMNKAPDKSSHEFNKRNTLPLHGNNRRRSLQNNIYSFEGHENASAMSEFSRPRLNIETQIGPSAYSGFNILSDSSSNQDDSPIPYKDIEATVTTLHLPPFVSDLNQSKGIRQTIVEHNDHRLFPSPDYLRNYMEERLVRWRPTDSQFNIDETMNGEHPFQVQGNTEQKGNSSESFYIVNLIKSWFTSTEAMSMEVEENPCIANKPVIEKSKMGSSNMAHRDIPTFKTITSKDITPLPMKNDIGELLKDMRFKENSSKSMLLPLHMHSLSQRTDAAVVMVGTARTLSEPSPVEEPLYTAKAMPFCDSDLIFEKRLSPSEVNLQGSGENIMSAMDDVPQLLFGVDNMFSGCLDGLSQFFTSIANCLGIS